MVSRVEQKKQTRRRLIKAALSQLSDDRSFATLSLREVAKEAGIAPTSFYRHFQDLDELGLAIVDEAVTKLRQMMLRARARGIEEGKTTVTSVETFIEFVDKNPNLFRRLLRERSGGSETYRRAIQVGIRAFTSDFAEEVERVGMLKDIHYDDPYIIAEAMVTLVFNLGAEVIDLPQEAYPALADKLVAQLRMVLAGAEASVGTSAKANTGANAEALMRSK